MVFRQAHYLYLSLSLLKLYFVPSFSTLSVYNEIYQELTMSNKVYNSSIVNIYNYFTRIRGMKRIQRSILPTKHPDRDALIQFINSEILVIGGFKKVPFFRKLSFWEISFLRILPFAEIFFLSYPFAIFLLVDAKILTLLGNCGAQMKNVDTVTVSSYCTLTLGP